MPAYSWDFTVNGSSATRFTQILQQNIVALTQFNQTINHSQTVINNYGQATERSGRVQEDWFHKLIRYTGYFNTLNKGIRFLVADLKWASGIFLNFTKQIQQQGGAFQMSTVMMKAYVDTNGQNAAVTEAIIAKSKALAAASKYTASEILDSATAMSKAGISSEDLEGNLQGVIDASLATGVPLAKMGNIAAITMSQFAEQGVTAKEALETLSAAANSTATSFEGMVAATKNAAPAAALLGISLSDTAAMLAGFAKSGIAFQRGGTALRVTLERLAAPTKQGKEALAKLGLTAEQLGPILSKPTEWIRIFHDRLEKIPTQAEKLAIMKPIFGQGALAMIPLIMNLDKAGVGFLDLQQKILTSKDAMKQLGEARVNTLQGAATMLKSSIQGIYDNLIEIVGVPFADYFKTWMDIVNKFNARLNELGKSFKQIKGVADFRKIIKEQGVGGLFQGFANEIKPELSKLKDIFSLVMETLKTVAQAAWQEIGQGLITAVAGVGSQVLDAIFNPTVIAKVTEIGITIGLQILEGLIKTPIGMLFIGAKSTEIVAGAAATSKGIFDSILKAGQTATTVAAASVATKAAKVAAAKEIGQTLAPFGIRMAPKAIPQVLPQAAKPAAGMLGGLGAAGVATVGMAAGIGYLGGKMISGEIERRTVEAEGKSRVAQIGMVSEALAELYTLQDKVNDPTKIKIINQQIAIQEEELMKLSGAYSVVKDARDEAMKPREKSKAEEIKNRSDIVESEAAVREKQKKWDDAAWRTRQEQFGKDEEKRKQAWIKNMAGAISGGAIQWNVGNKGFLNVQGNDLSRLGGEAGWEQHENIRRNIAAVKAAQAEKLMTFSEDAIKSYQDKNKSFDREQAIKGLTLETQGDELSTKQSLVDKQKQLLESEDASATTMGQFQIQIQNAGAAFTKWLVNPFNEFLQKILEVKTKFGEVIDTIKQKSLAVGEKFGLITGDEAKKQRAELLQKGMERDQQFLQLVQTPEEKQAIQERMAGRAEQLAELSTGQQQKDYAKQAQGFYGEAEKAAGTAQEQELERIQIEKRNALENIKTWEGMLTNIGSAGGKAELLGSLKEAYMMTGNVAKATEAQEQWRKAKVEEGVEVAENSKKTVEYLKVQVELQKLMVEALQNGQERDVLVQEHAEEYNVNNLEGTGN